MGFRPDFEKVLINPDRVGQPFLLRIVVRQPDRYLLWQGNFGPFLKDLEESIRCGIELLGAVVAVGETLNGVIGKLVGRFPGRRRGEMSRAVPLFPRFIMTADPLMCVGGVAGFWGRLMES